MADIVCFDVSVQVYPKPQQKVYRFDYAKNWQPRAD